MKTENLNVLSTILIVIQSEFENNCRIFNYLYSMFYKFFLEIVLIVNGAKYFNDAINNSCMNLTTIIKIQYKILLSLSNSNKPFPSCAVYGSHRIA